MTKKTISFILLLCVIFSCFMSVGFSVSAEDAAIVEVAYDSDTAYTGEDYGLADSCEDGNILHCFNWTLSQIKQELPNIAQAGFTSIQTSPLQAHDGSNQWYWLYQPRIFKVGNELGSANDLKSLCTEADKYGIKIIVDVVANHLAGSNSGSWSNGIDSSLRKSEYFHGKGALSDKNYTRYDVTHKNIGMPDLNSENTTLQEIIADYIEELKNLGVDGIRWDAAKHISLPSEQCAFWSRMSQIDIYQYGEILNDPAGDLDDPDDNGPLMLEYSQYIGVTDSKYSQDLRNAMIDGSVYRQSGNWTGFEVPSNRIVLWAESHDTYCNNGLTVNLTENQIDRIYAIVGAREGSQALYLSRPFEKSHTSIKYGVKGSTHFMSDEVAAVNRFHNAMVGKAEKYASTGGCYVVWRGGGAVLVSMKSSDVDVSVNNSGSMVPEGTYIDEVSGNSFTVTSKKITGHIGSTGIAVIYQKENPGVEITIGDVDGDDEVDITDATLIQRFNADMNMPESFCEAAGDIDGDGETDITDATLIQRYNADMIVSYPIAVKKTIPA